MQGVITTSGSLNWSTMPTIQLTVTAKDDSGQTISSNMTVIVEDVNSNAPTFERSTYVATIFENAPIGSPVLTVTATDADGGSNAVVGYSIAPSSDNGSQYFAVHPATGELVIVASLFGVVGDLYVEVVATDAGAPRLSSSTVVHVVVESVFDGSPEIVAPPENVTLYILEVVLFI